MSIESELEQVKEQERNWDVHGIPENETRMPYTSLCECTPDNCVHIRTRKDADRGELVMTYRCMKCFNSTTVIRRVGPAKTT